MIRKIVMLSGTQGSGKTTTANKLAQLAMDRGWTPYRTRFAKVLYAIHDAAGETARSFGIPWPRKYSRFLQILGTDLARKDFGENVWVDSLKEDVNKNASGNFTVVIIDDVRFPNEFDAFNGPDVYKIRLEASPETRKARCDGWRDNTEHPSETALNGHVTEGRFDLVINTENNCMDSVLEKIQTLVFGGF